jgi:hypothetical protein
VLALPPTFVVMTPSPQSKATKLRDESSSFVRLAVRLLRPFVHFLDV